MSGEKRIEDMSEEEFQVWVGAQGFKDAATGERSFVTLRTWGGKRGWVFTIVEGTHWEDVRELVILAIRAEHFANDREREHARKYPTPRPVDSAP